MAKDSKNSKSQKAVVKSVRLSASKTRKIETGFRTTVKESRSGYLSEQLVKYKGIKVSYD